MKWLIAFDLDGVLADVSRSCRAVVHETARLKQSGGLNNDWDLTYRIIDLLISLLGKIPACRRQGRRRSPFVGGLCRGEVGSGNLVRQIFQEVYPGAGRFAATYGIPPRVHTGKGYL
jgi:phosphoglycolate phosphatase-like HAD superfamily hydrolase